MFTWSLLIGIGSTLIAPGTTAEDFGTICHKIENGLVAKKAREHTSCLIPLTKGVGYDS
jgi:hypothetical protein